MLEGNHAEVETLGWNSLCQLENRQNEKQKVSEIEAITAFQYEINQSTNQRMLLMGKVHLSRSSLDLVPVGDKKWPTPGTSSTAWDRDWQSNPRLGQQPEWAAGGATAEHGTGELAGIAHIFSLAVYPNLSSRGGDPFLTMYTDETAATNVVDMVKNEIAAGVYCWNLAERKRIRTLSNTLSILAGLRHRFVGQQSRSTTKWGWTYLPYTKNTEKKTIGYDLKAWRNDRAAFRSKGTGFNPPDEPSISISRGKQVGSRLLKVTYPWTMYIRGIAVGLTAGLSTLRCFLLNHFMWIHLYLYYLQRINSHQLLGSSESS